MNSSMALIPCPETNCGQPDHFYSKKAEKSFRGDLKKADKKVMKSISGSHCAQSELIKRSMKTASRIKEKTKTREDAIEIDLYRNYLNGRLGSILRAKGCSYEELCGSSNHKGKPDDIHVFSPERSEVFEKRSQEINKLIFGGSKKPKGKSLPSSVREKNIEKAREMCFDTLQKAKNCEVNEIKSNIIESTEYMNEFSRSIGEMLLQREGSRTDANLYIRLADAFRSLHDDIESHGNPPVVPQAGPVGRTGGEAATMSGALPPPETGQDPGRAGYARTLPEGIRSIDFAYRS